ncbi:3-dehydroquinate synthase [Chlamydia abortus]|uniref:3-dehydroquinate synthase n=1 Tax=Chlamydia abortus (strain DSM 27085 / S26/3) TaxID=218497 RepID=AROB_CHLAB|nr:3-dehydroquinate synthase [Chlamydia abortus]Q5L5F1.1 RecName: Full=3-dehydroquinate synthase; Short=DHQS [Chlamydia abortus S26/3]CAH64140.1 putative 3-dehydroquinate synthase [Chlamydia abortus S26/3]SFW01991.1 3-dehydroquinate synthase [Chlamydia abortus]SFW02716.1 3-dehydroquinate synthase [Chlamydia abortus]SFW02769.1 3-dehydroquinate synthase [Chlamydia abortus]SFW04755.1 3-dehydroquinate synthase [Chlamydia abortus]
MIENLISHPHHIKLVGDFFNKKLFSSISTDHPLVILTDVQVAKEILPPIVDFIHSLDYTVVPLSFPSGEKNKTWETFISLQNQLIDHDIPLGSTMIGIGGGVVLDMVGFLASTYCRGIPLFLVPTTMTAMIDACIGGKNGINLRGLKNRLGTFYLPQDVWICPEFLSTLPKKEWLYGISEAIKHGCIADASIWEFLHNYGDMLFSSREILSEFIKRNCLVKAAIVAKDPHDQHLRKILNFGHTIAHAIETLSQGCLPHGLAVSVGMMIETKISLESGIMKNPALLEQLHHLSKRFHLPTTLEELRDLIPQHLHHEFYDPENIIHALGYDKKNLSKKAIRMVMMEDAGKATSCNGIYCTVPKMAILYEILKSECYAMCNN